MIDSLAWTLLHFLWQGAVLGFLAFLLLRLARPDRAATRYAIGVATLGLMLITSIATYAILSQAAPAAIAGDRFAVFPATGSVPQFVTSVDETVNEVTKSGNAQSIIRT